MIFSFGGNELERIEVEVTGYERDSVGEYYDDNWLTAEFRVFAGGFRGNAASSVLTRELVDFRDQLQALSKSLRGTAEFKTMEGQLELKLSGDGKGHIELVGDMLDQAGIGNRLCFKLYFDQTQLKASVHELELVITKFPVRGENK